MEITTYTTLTRHAGLMREMAVVANNIANLSTPGFRAEGLIFAEHVTARPDAASVSMAKAEGRILSHAQGTLTQTGAPFDFAIEGAGFFLVETPTGPALTRAGHFFRSAFGELTTADGYPVMDAAGAPVFVPPDAGDVTLGADGTISSDGQPLGQLGLWQPAGGTEPTRRAGVLFEATGGVEPAPDGRILQGFLERSNVNAIAEMARMIEVQRAYELGQGFLDREHDRIRDFLRTVGARS